MRLSQRNRRRKSVVISRRGCWQHCRWRVAVLPVTRMKILLATGAALSIIVGFSPSLVAFTLAASPRLSGRCVWMPRSLAPSHLCPGNVDVRCATTTTTTSVYSTTTTILLLFLLIISPTHVLFPIYLYLPFFSYSCVY